MFHMIYGVVDRANVLGSAMNQMGRILGHALRHRDLIVTFQNEPGGFSYFIYFFMA